MRINSGLKIVICFLATVLMVGCASVDYKEIRRQAAEVDLSDGMTDEEAILTAQKFILTKGHLDRLHSIVPIRTTKKMVWIKNDGEQVFFTVPPGDAFQFDVQTSWIVLFRDREGSLFKGFYPINPFFVEVGEQGNIIDWGINRSGVADKDIFDGPGFDTDHK